MISKLIEQKSSETSSKTHQRIDYICQYLLEIGKQILAEIEVEQVLTLAIDYAIETTESERGMIILFDDDDNFIVETARTLNKTKIVDSEIDINRAIIRMAIIRRKPVCKRNMQTGDLAPQSETCSNMKMHSVICVPLIHAEKLFGVIYLDNTSVSKFFHSDFVRFIHAYADFISDASFRAFERRQLLKRVSEWESTLRTNHKFESIIGQHPKMLELLQLISQIADTDATVLIQGESGTGKELIARALHYNSSRKNKPFVPINCGALAENLLESELFGHSRGAFTGAWNDKPGWFECADGGTIFLDEVSEMSPGLQVKMLRVLQTREYSKVGETKLRRCDVRIIAATNKDLQVLIRQRTFREDLYYRLNVIDLLVPPLRERKSDIPLLIQYFLKTYGSRYNKKNLKFTNEAENIILSYDFPGNCRELENIIQHAVLLCSNKHIHPSHLPQKLCTHSCNSSFKKTALSSFRLSKKRMIEKFEHDYLIDCLQASRGHITNAAKAAGLNVKNFYYKIKKYAIDPNSFKPSRIK